MKEKKRSLIFYLSMILLFGTLIYAVIRQGEVLQNPGGINRSFPTPGSLAEGYRVFMELVQVHGQSSVGLLLLQIVVILITCRVVGWLFNRLGQPTVIGEIMAGIILGPSVLGLAAPGISQFLFPSESLPQINVLSHFGLILFMYTIGMELNLKEVGKKLRESIVISHTSMLLPFFLGTLTAYFIYNNYACADTPFLPFALFIGIALSISAFPVLARIIQERKLMRTQLGTLALSSAAADNITAWYILAVIVAIARAGSMLSAVYNILFSVVYMAVMFLIVRPLLRMLGNVYHNKEVVNKSMVSLMFLILLLSSFFTEILGLHALFGAFIAGMVMPENFRFRKIMTEKVEDVSLALFLPLFFASTGLRTEIGLLNTPDMWMLCGIFIVIAIAGKVGGAVLAARFTRQSWKNSLFLGGLMNTRGLMELVVLTIGYEMHILSPPLFVILVLMTLVTTFMTTPLLGFIAFCFRANERIVRLRQERGKTDAFHVLLSFGRAGNGQIMLDVAHQMFSQGKSKLQLTALHLTVGSDVNPLHTDNFERISFGPVLYEAKRLNMQIQTRYEISSNAAQSIVSIVNEDHYDFLLVGAGISMSNLTNDVEARHIRASFSRLLKPFHTPDFLISPRSLIKDKTKQFIEHTRCPVGIFVNRNFVKATQILLIIHSAGDLFLLDYAKTLVHSTHGRVSILNRSSFISSENERILQAITGFVDRTEDAIVLPEKDILTESLADHNFMLLSYPTWNILSVEHEETLKDMPSTLIIRHSEKTTHE